MNLEIGQKIDFKIPYFESYFKFTGTIVEIKNKIITVKYSNTLNFSNVSFITQIFKESIL